MGQKYGLAVNYGNLSLVRQQYPSEVDDEGLLRLVWQGDEQAFSELFSRHQGPIYRYAVHMCGREAGDDVVQETFLALLRHNGRYDPSRGSLVAYLFGIARHFVMRQLTARCESALAGELDECRSGTVGQGQPTVLDRPFMVPPDYTIVGAGERGGGARGARGAPAR